MPKVTIEEKKNKINNDNYQREEVNLIFGGLSYNKKK